METKATFRNQILQVLFFSLLCVNLLSAQIRYTGVVYASCNQQGATPLPGVSVSIQGMGSPKVTNSDGSFTFVFNQDQGQMVTLNISKNGYELRSPNRRMTGNNPDDPAIFYMCRSSEEASQQALDRALVTRLENIEELIGQSAKDSQEYQDLLAQKEAIEYMLSRQDKKIEDLLRENSNKDWTILHSEIMQTLLQPQEGIVEEEDVSYQIELVGSLLDIIWETYTEAELDSLRQYGDPEVQKEVTLNTLQAYVYAEAYEFEEAEKCFVRLRELEPDNVEHVLGLAGMYDLQDKRQQAVELYEQARQMPTEDEILPLEISIALAGLYLTIDQPDKAYGLLAESQNKCKKLIKRDTTNFYFKQSLQADIYETYGIYYLQNNQFSESIEALKKAQATYRKFHEEEGRGTNALATINTKIASVLATIHRYNDAMGLLKESNELFSSLSTTSQDGPAMQRNEVLFQIANLYMARNDYDAAEELFSQLRITFRHLVPAFPEIFRINIANVLYAEGQLNQQQKNFVIADGKLDEALQIYRDLERKGFGPFPDQVANILNARGDNHLSYKKYEEAKRDMDAARQINQKLVKLAPQTHEPTLAGTYSSLGRYFRRLDNPDSAYYYFNKAHDILERYAAEGEEVYTSSLIKAEEDLGLYYYGQGDSDKAKEILDRALEKAQALLQLDSTVFMPTYAATLLEHGMAYMDENVNEDAIQRLEESLAIYRALGKEEPGVYELQQVTILWGLGTIYSFIDEPQKTQRYFQEALEICENAPEGKRKRVFAPSEARIYLSKAELSSDEQDWDNALYFYDQAEERFRRLNGRNYLEEYHDAIGNINISKAQIGLFREDYEAAQIASDEAREIYISLKDGAAEQGEDNPYIAKLAMVEMASAELQSGQQEYHEAMQSYRRAGNQFRLLSQKEPPTYQLKELETQQGIGEVQQALSQRSQAVQTYKNLLEELFRGAEKYPEHHKAYYGMVVDVYYSLGQINYRESPAEAGGYFNQTLQLIADTSLVDSKRYRYKEASSHLFFSIMYLNAGQNPETIESAQRTVQLVERNFTMDNPNRNILLIQALKFQADAYFRLEEYDDAANQYRACLQFGERALTDVFPAVTLLRMKMNAGISIERSSDDTGGVSLLQQVRSDIINADLRTDADKEWAAEMLQIICDYIDCD
ncbi:MAG: hypothetical protein AAFP77_23725 [Bacteroidota bacterium]